MNERNLEKAAERGEPSYVWRAGQDRRMEMIRNAAGLRLSGTILENGCGIGMYVERLKSFGGQVVGLEFDLERAAEAYTRSTQIVNAAGENLPFSNEIFDLILSHEVLEHVANDRAAAIEMVRTLRSGGRIMLFVPNRGYPVETHGIYWKGRYRFGNIPLINYLPRRWRNQLAPHVRVYSGRDLEELFLGMPVEVVERRIIFGAYDNIIAGMPRLGRALRAILHRLEKTPLQVLGLSHFWVIEKQG
jgi:SAM-dependent methyltransferase